MKFKFYMLKKTPECNLMEAPHNFFKPMPSSLIGASWLRNSLPYTTIPLLYPHVRVFMAAEAF